MATRIWRGDAVDIAQVVTVQVTADDSATTYTITINNKDVSVAGSGVDVDTTAAALQAALDASTIPEFAEVTWTVATDTITGTADTAGKPFTATSSATGGTGTIGAVTTTTAATGKNFWDNQDNWTGNAVPVSTDDVVITNNSVPIKYGLDQNAVDLTSLTVDRSFSGNAQIGLPEINSDNSNGEYYEYRDTYLKIGATTVTIGDGDGNGTDLIKLDLDTTATTVTVHHTATARDTDLPACILQGSNAANILDVRGGTVGTASLPGNTAQFPTIRQSGNSTLSLSSGTTTPTTVTKEGNGTLNTEVGATTLTAEGGIVNVSGSTSVVTLNANQGTVNYECSGTITTLTLNGANFNRGEDLRALTITNCTWRAGGFFDSNQTITFSNAIAIEGRNQSGSINGITCNIGNPVNILPS